MEKAGLIGLVKMRLLISDEELSLRGKVLRDAIADDKQRGLIPFYVRLNCIVNRRHFVPMFSCAVHVLYQVKPRRHRQQCRSNIVECYKSNDSFDKVECCFDIVAGFEFDEDETN